MMNRTFLIITGLLVVGAIFFTSANSENIQGYQVGDYATDFNLKGVDGKMVSLSNYSTAKGFIVVFTCNTCPYAKEYEQRIINLDNTFRAKGFPVIAINPNDPSQSSGDSMEEMKSRATSQNYPFPYLRDDVQEVTTTYGASKTPHVFVLNKEAAGKFKVEYIGAIDDSPREAADASEKYVEDAVNTLLAGKKPMVKEKRAIGCSIKWKGV
ncbi:MAG: thioredoxin family protein [Bacteroidota bacterium]